MIMFGGILLGAPVMLLGVTLITCMFVGWTALIGVVSFTLFIPFQVHRENFSTFCFAVFLVVGSQDR